MNMMVSADAVTNKQQSDFMAWCRDHDSGADCTPQAYGYLAGVIDGITQPDAHKDVLQLLLGHRIDHDHRPAAQLVDGLLDWLPKTKGRGIKKQLNPSYRPDYASCIARLHETVMRGKGQLGFKEVLYG